MVRRLLRWDAAQLVQHEVLSAADSGVAQHAASSAAGVAEAAVLVQQRLPPMSVEHTPVSGRMS